MDDLTDISDSLGEVIETNCRHHTERLRFMFQIMLVYRKRLSYPITQIREGLKRLLEQPSLINTNSQAMLRYMIKLEQLLRELNGGKYYTDLLNNAQDSELNMDNSVQKKELNMDSSVQKKEEELLAASVQKYVVSQMGMEMQKSHYQIHKLYIEGAEIYWSMLATQQQEQETQISDFLEKYKSTDDFVAHVEIIDEFLEMFNNYDFNRYDDDDFESGDKSCCIPCYGDDDDDEDEDKDAEHVSHLSNSDEKVKKKSFLIMPRMMIFALAFILLLLLINLLMKLIGNS